ncbi:NTE family protein [Frankineae bacterium MT45]|nr:NTE family protein [Frankineae bacterium MT45]
MSRALVLGGGGTAGIAWQTGLLAGLEFAGTNTLNADMILGTSAGATVAAQITSPMSLTELMRRQTDPALQVAELKPPIPVADVLTRIGELAVQYPEQTALRRAIGVFALTQWTVDEPTRRAVIAERLPSHDWPSTPLYLVAVRADNGETAIFGQGSGVRLVDAVAASCAVPGVWPPVTLGAHRYIDGGVRSGANVDLVGIHDKVLVIAPMAPDLDVALNLQIAAVSSTSAVHLIVPDAASREAIGPDPLNSSVRAVTARAGFAQGQLIAESVRNFWG